MATITIKLRKDKKNKQGTCPLAVRYAEGGKEVLFSTRQSIREEDFINKESAWIKSTVSNAPDLNIILLNAITKVRKIYTQFVAANERDPNPKEMRDLYDLKSDPKKSKALPFFDLFNEFVRYQSSGRGIDNVKFETSKNHIKLKKRIEEYAKYAKISFDFSHIDKLFANKFQAYLSNERHNVPNTIGANMKVLKTFLNWCENHKDIHIGKPVMSTIKVISEQKWRTYMTLEELDRLFELDFTNRPFFERSRDAFVLMACIGCRHGDMARTLAQNIVKKNDKWFFKIRTMKNEKLTDVPLSERAWTILEKYQGQDVKEWAPSNQQLNSDIKIICKEAGFTEEIQTSKGTGTTREDTITKRYNDISCHTGRRSFINICLDMGIDDRTIAAMTGQSLKTLQGYKFANTKNIEDAIAKWDAIKPKAKDKAAPEPKAPNGNDEAPSEPGKSKDE